MSNRALSQHPPDARYPLPVLQPSVTVTTHRCQKPRPEVIVPPNDRVVIDARPHANHLADGEEAVAQHTLDNFLQHPPFGSGLGAKLLRTGRS